MRVHLAVLLLALLSASACSNREEASCSAAAAHVITLVRAELTKDGDAKRLKQAQVNLPTLQNALLQSCEKEKWKPTVRRCIIEAKSAAQTKECAPMPSVPVS